MKKHKRRDAWRVRFAVLSMPEGLEKQISLAYMGNYSEMDIRDEFGITVNQLRESKEKIKAILLEAGVQE